MRPSQLREDYPLRPNRLFYPNYLNDKTILFTQWLEV